MVRATYNSVSVAPSNVKVGDVVRMNPEWLTSTRNYVVWKVKPSLDGLVLEAVG